MIEALEQGDSLRVIGSHMLPATTLRVTGADHAISAAFQSEQDGTASEISGIFPMKRRSRCLFSPQAFNAFYGTRVMIGGFELPLSSCGPVYESGFKMVPHLLGAARQAIF